VGIGQGYNSFTPLQLAHAVSNLTNNGIVMKPHLVKMVESGTTKARKLTVPKESYRIPLKQDNIDFIKQAMIGVTKEGTSARSFANAPYISGGKTGTAQAAALSRNVKYDASKISERLRDHSLYIGFAPADKPRIALAVIVENAGFGAAAAAPIARLAMDYYLTGKRPDEPAKPAAKVGDSVQSTQPATVKLDATKPVVKAADTSAQSSAQSAAVKTDVTKPVVKASEATQPTAVKSDTTKLSTPKPVEPNRGAPQ
jgi:penicillin-binding protein 2